MLIFLPNVAWHKGDDSFISISSFEIGEEEKLVIEFLLVLLSYIKSLCICIEQRQKGRETNFFLVFFLCFPKAILQCSRREKNKEEESMDVFYTKS